MRRDRRKKEGRGAGAAKVKEMLTKKRKKKLAVI